MTLPSGLELVSLFGCGIVTLFCCFHLNVFVFLPERVVMRQMSPASADMKRVSGILHLPITVDGASCGFSAVRFHALWFVE